MLKEFKEFALKGNMIDMAVGIIIGGAFGGVITSLVNDVIMPPIGALLGGADFSKLFVVIKEGATAAPYATLEAAVDAGAVTLNWGAFVNTLINFVIVAFVIFMVIRAMNKLRRAEPEPELDLKECPFCKSEIVLAATRCPACTSELAA
jgi:large conductance mechanosensitive channel